MTEKLVNLEKVDKSMKANLKQAEDTVAKINATKADKKDQQEVIAKIDSLCADHLPGRYVGFAVLRK